MQLLAVFATQQSDLNSASASSWRKIRRVLTGHRQHRHTLFPNTPHRGDHDERDREYSDSGSDDQAERGDVRFAIGHKSVAAAIAFTVAASIDFGKTGNANSLLVFYDFKNIV